MPKKSARKPRKPIPAPLQRCVTAVAPKMKAQGRGVGAAFAICTSQLQKSGVLKPGTRTVTHRGAGVISGIARRGEYRSTMREFERAITRKNGADWVEPPVVASTTYKVSPSERGTVGWSEVRVDMRVGRHVIDFDVFHDGRQSGFLASYGELRRTLRYDDVAERHTDRIMAQVDRMIASYPGVVRRDIPGLSGYHGHYFPRKNGSSLTRGNPTAKRPAKAAKRGATVTLYHTTYARNLPSIAKHGLRPAAKAALMRAAPGNIRGVYLSSAEGVPFWFGKLVDWARHDSDNPVEDGMVPVVLRVTTTCGTVEDAIGSRDAMSDAVVCSRPIVPGAIRVWDGASWVPLSQEVDQHKGARWVEDEDFDEGGYAELLGPYESPLVPRL